MHLGPSKSEVKHWEGNREHLEEGQRIAEAFIDQHRAQNSPNVADMASHRAKQTRSMLGGLFH